MKKIIKVLLRYFIYVLLFLGLEYIVLCYDKKLIALILFVALFWKPVRYFWFNFDRVFRSFIVNSINYFRYKEYNYPSDIGVIDGYFAHTNKVFGCCKTLSAVVKVYKLYHKYNGKKTYDYRSQSPHWITWNVNVIANVDIDGVPVIPFKNLDQLVALADQDNSEMYNIVLIDECNAVMNSRNFKNNFQNEEQIKSLVTARHNNMYLIMVGQRYRYLDALVRGIMDRCIECVHVPLINTVIHYCYSAYDLESVDNPAYIKRLWWNWTYILPWQYKLYDTKALVDLISKEEMLPSDQVLAKRFRTGTQFDARNLTRKGRKMIKGS